MTRGFPKDPDNGLQRWLLECKKPQWWIYSIAVGYFLNDFSGSLCMTFLYFAVSDKNKSTYTNRRVILVLYLLKRHVDISG